MHITIIDDEVLLSEKIKKKLENEHYSVSVFHSYSEFLREGSVTSGLYLIDLSLGDGSGFDIIKWLRNDQWVTAPIMMISGYWDSANIVYGLGIGADDYLTKPFAPEVLLAHILALLRRTNGASSGRGRIITYHDIVFDLESSDVSYQGNSIILTKQEMTCLLFFLTHIGEVIKRDVLIAHVWGSKYLINVTDNTLNVTLSRLRKKFDGAFPVQSIYGEGFFLEP